MELQRDSFRKSTGRAVLGIGVDTSTTAGRVFEQLGDFTAIEPASNRMYLIATNRRAVTGRPGSAERTVLDGRIRSASAEGLVLAIVNAPPPQGGFQIEDSFSLLGEGLIEGPTPGKGSRRTGPRWS